MMQESKTGSEAAGCIHHIAHCQRAGNGQAKRAGSRCQCVYDQTI
jgi:hypothetical protein